MLEKCILSAKEHEGEECHGAYPGLAAARRVTGSRLLEWVTAIFRGCGMAQGDAALLADTLVRADLRGIHSHGVLRVPEYVAKLTTGGVDPHGRPRCVGATIAGRWITTRPWPCSTT